MPPNKMAASLVIVIGASGLVMVILYSVGILEIPITVLFAVVDALMVIGLVLVRAFLRSSIARLPGPLYFTVVAYILATASFVYSSSYWNILLHRCCSGHVAWVKNWKSFARGSSLNAVESNCEEKSVTKE